MFRRIVLPNILPGILSGCVLGFARSLGEIGSILLLTTGLLHTQVVAVLIFNLVNAYRTPEASAIAVVLLAAGLVCLLLFGALRYFSTRYERA